jgi:hypothetical protein
MVFLGIGVAIIGLLCFLTGFYIPGLATGLFFLIFGVCSSHDDEWGAY